jgi:hypothetical protein
MGMTELFWKFVTSPVASPKFARLEERYWMSLLTGAMKMAASSAYREVRMAALSFSNLLKEIVAGCQLKDLFQRVYR